MVKSDFSDDKEKACSAIVIHNAIHKLDQDMASNIITQLTFKYLHGLAYCMKPTQYTRIKGDFWGCYNNLTKDTLDSHYIDIVI